MFEREIASFNRSQRLMKAAQRKYDDMSPEDDYALSAEEEKEMLEAAMLEEMFPDFEIDNDIPF